MAITFQDVTQSAGIKSTREVLLSISWLDLNSDSKPDLWISPHGYSQRSTPKLYLNQGDGTFTNITSQVFPDGIKGDAHGTS